MRSFVAVFALLSCLFALSHGVPLTAIPDHFLDHSPNSVSVMIHFNMNMGLVNATAVQLEYIQTMNSFLSTLTPPSAIPAPAYAFVGDNNAIVTNGMGGLNAVIISPQDNLNNEAYVIFSFHLAPQDFYSQWFYLVVNTESIPFTSLVAQSFVQSNTVYLKQADTSFQPLYYHNLQGYNMMQVPPPALDMNSTFAFTIAVHFNVSLATVNTWNSTTYVNEMVAFFNAGQAQGAIPIPPEAFSQDHTGLLPGGPSNVAPGAIGTYAFFSLRIDPMTNASTVPQWALSAMNAFNMPPNTAQQSIIATSIYFKQIDMNFKPIFTQFCGMQQPAATNVLCPALIPMNPSSSTGGNQPPPPAPVKPGSDGVQIPIQNYDTTVGAITAMLHFTVPDGSTLNATRAFSEIVQYVNLGTNSVPIPTAAYNDTTPSFRTVYNNTYLIFSVETYGDYSQPWIQSYINQLPNAAGASNTTVPQNPDQLSYALSSTYLKNIDYNFFPRAVVSCGNNFYASVNKDENCNMLPPPPQSSSSTGGNNPSSSTGGNPNPPPQGPMIPDQFRDSTPGALTTMLHLKPSDTPLNASIAFGELLTFLSKGANAVPVPTAAYNDSTTAIRTVFNDSYLIVSVETYGDLSQPWVQYFIKQMPILVGAPNTTQTSDQVSYALSSTYLKNIDYNFFPVAIISCGNNFYASVNRGEQCSSITPPPPPPSGSGASSSSTGSAPGGGSMSSSSITSTMTGSTGAASSSGTNSGSSSTGSTNSASSSSGTGSASTSTSTSSSSSVTGSGSGSTGASSSSTGARSSSAGSSSGSAGSTTSTGSSGSSMLTTIPAGKINLTPYAINILTHTTTNQQSLISADNFQKELQQYISLSSIFVNSSYGPVTIPESAISGAPTYFINDTSSTTLYFVFSWIPSPLNATWYTLLQQYAQTYSPTNVNAAQANYVYNQSTVLKNYLDTTYSIRAFTACPSGNVVPFPNSCAVSSSSSTGVAVSSSSSTATSGGGGSVSSTGSSGAARTDGSVSCDVKMNVDYATFNNVTFAQQSCQLLNNGTNCDRFRCPNYRPGSVIATLQILAALQANSGADPNALINNLVTLITSKSSTLGSLSLFSAVDTSYIPRVFVTCDGVQVNGTTCPTYSSSSTAGNCNGQYLSNGGCKPNTAVSSAVPSFITLFVSLIVVAVMKRME